MLVNYQSSLNSILIIILIIALVRINRSINKMIKQVEAEGLNRDSQILKNSLELGEFILKTKMTKD